MARNGGPTSFGMLDRHGPEYAGTKGATPDTDKGYSIGLPRQLSTLPRRNTRKIKRGPKPSQWYYLRFLLGACVRADPATLFFALVDFGLRRIFAALLATDFEVFSFRPPPFLGIFQTYIRPVK